MDQFEEGCGENEAISLYEKGKFGQHSGRGVNSMETIKNNQFDVDEILASSLTNLLSAKA